MTGKERLVAALEHRQADRPPIDLGATMQTGISASTLYHTQKALGLAEKEIDIINVFQMLGEVKEPMRKALGVDVVGIPQPWARGGQALTMWDGTPVRMPKGVLVQKQSSGDTLYYPQGDASARPSSRMPDGGSFFDHLVRGAEVDEDSLTPVEDFMPSFPVYSDDAARYFDSESVRRQNEGDYGVVGIVNGLALGDAGQLPAPNEREPRGIRRMDEWLMAHILFPDYIRAVFRLQTDVMLKNLEIYRQAVGERIQAVVVSTADFGTQTGPFIAVDTFRELYKPFYREVCDWIHTRTGWKTWFHCCGSVVDFLDDFVDMGVDILNPVQLSAKGMDAAGLKAKYGDRLVFWGGASDTQATLPYGTPQEVRNETLERLNIFSKGGGYVTSAIHNIVAKVPPENVLALFETAANFRN